MPEDSNVYNQLRKKSISRVGVGAHSRISRRNQGRGRHMGGLEGGNDRVVISPAPRRPDDLAVTFPKNVIPPWNAMPFYHRKSLSIIPGASNVQTVLEIIPTEGQELYLSTLGHTMPNDKLSFFLYYDRTLWKQWQYQIGSPTSPIKFDCAIRAAEGLSFKVSNQYATPVLVEVVMSGWKNPIGRN